MPRGGETTHKVVRHQDHPPYLAAVVVCSSLERAGFLDVVLVRARLSGVEVFVHLSALRCNCGWRNPPFTEHVLGFDQIYSSTFVTAS